MIVRAEDARDLKALDAWTRDADPWIRARAVRAIGRAQDTTSIARLAALLNDRDAGVRAEAIFALGQEWKAAAEPALLGVLAGKPSDYERWLALEGLGKCAAPGGKGMEALSQALDIKPHQGRRVPRRIPTFPGLIPQTDTHAALALGVAAYRFKMLQKVKWQVPSPVLMRLAEMSADTRVWPRMVPTYALYRFAWSGAMPKPPAAVRKALEARRSDAADPIVRALAYQALGFVAAPNGLAPGQGLQDPDWRVRVAAAEALGKAGSSGTDEALAAALKDAQPLVAVTALRALDARKATTQAAAVEAVLDDAGAREMVRAEAVRVLAALRGDAALPLLDESSRHAVWRMRRSAATGLGVFLGLKLSEQASSEGWVSLQRLLVDQDARVRAAAVEAIASLGKDPRTPALLLQALADKDLVVRATAADALGERKDAAAVPALLDTLKGLDSAKDVEVMMSVVDALGSIKDARAVSTLRRLASDRDFNLASKAAKALRLVQPGADVKVRPYAAGIFTASPEALDFAVAHAHRAITAVVHTARGDLTLKLFPGEAPLTVWNFVKLARKGYFNGIMFHRVVPNFVVQGGDPRGDGWGGPGYEIRCEYNALRYGRGAVGMALAGKDTGGSQWFITHSPQPHLDGRFTIFGQLVKGDDVLDALTEGDRIVSVDVQP